MVMALTDYYVTVVKAGHVYTLAMPDHLEVAFTLLDIVEEGDTVLNFGDVVDTLMTLKSNPDQNVVVVRIH